MKPLMDRDELKGVLDEKQKVWDMIVIGGGASGLGVAIDAAARGYQTLLLEMDDFAKGTSSRSTKLVHGGVRYLQQGDISLVMEALRERGLMLQNAPHLVSHQAFIVPNYEWWEGPFYGIGLKVYDALARKLGLGPSRYLSKDEILKRIPNLETERLKGGVIYYDGQFDDSRLATNMAQTVLEQGGVPLNYMKVTGLTKSGDMVNGVQAVDQETGKEYEIYSRVVINATGPFADSILKMDDANTPQRIKPGQGVHIILDNDFLQGDTAVMVPHTSDGRVMFAVPWNNKVVVGTTDTPLDRVDEEPVPLKEEIDFILENASQYLAKDPSHSDIRSTFAGLRPLVRSGEGGETANLSRSHEVIVTTSGLVTIAGGKWTTYRQMAEDTIDKASLVAGDDVRPCPTENLRIHGWTQNLSKDDPYYYYGTDAYGLHELNKTNPELDEKLHSDLPYRKTEVVWAARHEMARTVEDVLSRRTRALLLDARAASEVAPEVARLLASELGKDEKWQNQQVEQFRKLAQNYIAE